MLMFYVNYISTDMAQEILEFFSSVLKWNINYEFM
jgi:hypothetical protein